MEHVVGANTNFLPMANVAMGHTASAEMEKQSTRFICIIYPDEHNIEPYF